jgi:hypothetical protein
MDFVEGTRARLHGARSTKQKVLGKLTTAEATAADGIGKANAVASLELELDEAEDREATLEAEFMTLWPSVLTLNKHRGVAKNRFEDEVEELMDIPELPGRLEDEHLVSDAEERYDDGVLLLDEFLDMQYRTCDSVRTQGQLELVIQLRRVLAFSPRNIAVFLEQQKNVVLSSFVHILVLKYFKISESCKIVM